MMSSLVSWLLIMGFVKRFLSSRPVSTFLATCFCIFSYLGRSSIKSSSKVLLSLMLCFNFFCLNFIRFCICFSIFSIRPIFSTNFFSFFISTSDTISYGYYELLQQSESILEHLSDSSSQTLLYSLGSSDFKILRFRNFNYCRLKGNGGKSWCQSLTRLTIGSRSVAGRVSMIYSSRVCATILGLCRSRCATTGTACCLDIFLLI